MAKWADYLVSGVWFSQTPVRHISHVMLHADNEQYMGIGVKHSREEVIALLKQKKHVRTTIWDHNVRNWIKGGLVEYKKMPDGMEYLRTNRDAAEHELLENLINMASFGGL